MNDNGFVAVVGLLLAFFFGVSTYFLSQKVDELVAESEYWQDVAGCESTVEDLVLNAYICVTRNHKAERR